MGFPQFSFLNATFHDIFHYSGNVANLTSIFSIELCRRSKCHAEAWSRLELDLVLHSVVPIFKFKLELPYEIYSWAYITI